MNRENVSLNASVDLTNCDREPIHLLGNVQTFGALIAVSADWIVQHASMNTAEILGIEASEMIGRPLGMFFPKFTVDRLREKISSTSQEDSVARMFGAELFEDRRLYDVSTHQSDMSFIFEFELKATDPVQKELELVAPMLKRVSRHDDLVAASKEAAAQLRALTGFDRVMVYQFAPEGDGTVIAEAKDPQDTETYLGLHFPASDIPRQARALYKRSLLRLISDVDAEVIPIIPEASPEGNPLDLSLAVTRAVSPIHLEYLRNLKIRASMSVSIVIRGELWGLFACHHREPLYIDYERRTAVELLGQFFAYEIERQESRAVSDATGRAQRLHNRLMMQMTARESLVDAFPGIAREIATVISHDGIALYSDGEYVTSGNAPDEKEFEAIARFLNTAAASRVYATDNLVTRLPSIAHMVDRCAGILAIPVSRTPRDYLVLFRAGHVHQVKWAGNPHKPVESGQFGTRLTPRKSFEVWKEDIGHRSQQWSPTSLRAAEAMRVTLLEVVLKLSDEVNAERKKAHDQQELLIAELNHRVRNMLGLIRSLVGQSRRSAETIEEFTNAVDGRIHALAQAHDQLTRTEWTPVAMHKLLSVELGAYLTEDSDRIRITGTPVMLAPEAFSTMALVFHELVTNSVKYGALSTPSGGVTVDVQRQNDGLTRVTWTEAGGPAVKAPDRRGFGTTIIEKSIPFELKGQARVDFNVSGLHAEFQVPDRYVREEPGLQVDDAEVRDVSGDQEAPALSGVILVVEDNMIIAMDAADILSDLGASAVHVASSVAEALRMIEAHAFSAAVLDVNLGAETSLPVAQVLHARGVPFMLASGYGSQADALAQFPKAPVIAKPFTVETLSRALSKLLA
ncbi:HWE histidine kinase domain-containing protein [Sulfitobacter sp. LCG007]